MEYINEIINNSDGQINIWNREYYLYKSNMGLIPVRIHKQDGYLFNGLRYIEGKYDTTTRVINPFEGRFIYPVGRILNNPEEFLNKFKPKQEISLPMEFISKKQLTKEFKGELINRKNVYIYKGRYNYYYYLPDKYIVSNKEYKQFKSNKEAVRIKYQFNGFSSECEWFNNMEEFMNMRNEEYESLNLGYKSSAKYTVIKKGFNWIPPDERKAYVRLPYFDIHMYDDKPSNDSHKIYMINRYLIKEMNNYKHFSADRDFNFHESDFYEIVKIICEYENGAKQQEFWK